MSKPTWPETVMAGKLFSLLTADEGLLQTGWPMLEYEAIAIDHGTIKLELKDGREFELTVRQLK